MLVSFIGGGGGGGGGERERERERRGVVYFVKIEGSGVIFGCDLKQLFS